MESDECLGVRKALPLCNTDWRDIFFLFSGTGRQVLEEREMGEADVVARDAADIVDFGLENQRHCVGMLGTASYMYLWPQSLEPKIQMKGSCGWLEDMYDRKAATLMAEALLQLPNLIRSYSGTGFHLR